MLYHLAFTVEYGGDQTQQDLFRIWAKETDAAIDAKESGAVVGVWKVVGERRVFAVVDIDSPDTLDQILFDLPIMKQHGQYVNVVVTPLRSYEDFAADLKERLP